LGKGIGSKDILSLNNKNFNKKTENKFGISKE
jgi:hypothetical protein